MTRLKAGVKCDARDPRDKVFAVLNLMDPYSRVLIPVDYSASTATMFYRALVAVMANARNLNLLTCIAYLHTVEGRTDLPMDTSAFEAIISDCDPHWTRSCQHWQPMCGMWRDSVDVINLQGAESPFTASTNLDMSYTAYCSAPIIGSVMPSVHVRAHSIDTIVKQNNAQGGYFTSLDRDSINSSGMPLWIKTTCVFLQ